MARILALSNLYPPHGYGGYELSCRDVVVRWRARGHRVTVLTSDVRRAGVADGDEPDVRRTLRLTWADHRFVPPTSWRVPAHERHNHRALADALDDVRPDVVSVWNMGAVSTGLLAALADRGVPVVLVVCNEWLDFAPRTDPWMRWFLGRPRLGALAERVTGVPARLPDLGQWTTCFVSAAVRAHAERRTPWSFDDSEVVHSGIDTDDFPVAASYEPRPWRWRLLYAGRVDRDKGIETAVRAAAALAPAGARLDVVGAGDPDEAARLVALGGPVTFHDQVDRDALRVRYLDADVVVFPSVWDEPFGLVPVEAMACGTPVVATGTGGSGEFMVDGENCVRFPPGDVDGLVAAVRRLADDESLRRRVVEGGLATASRLSVDRLAGLLEARHVRG